MGEQKREKKEVVIAENRDFKGVWIPERLYLTREFTPNEKFILLEIYSLTGKASRECFANNKHFADFVGLKENTVQKAMLKFANAGYIKRDYEYKENTREIERRTIKLTKKFYDNFINETDKNEELKNEPYNGMENNPEGNGIKSTTPMEKNQQGGGQKSTDKYNSNKFNNGLSNTGLSETGFKKLNNACFSDGKGTVAHERPKRTFTFEERMAMLNRMPERAKKIATDKGYDFDCANNIADFIFYFVLRYYQKTGDTHPILKNETLEYVIEKVTENQVDEYREFGALVTDEPGDERYKSAVDDYFGTKFGKDVNYNLSHFVSGDIIKNLMYHTGEYC